MAEGRVAATASFGFGFAMLSLIEWMSDWGGMVLQSRVGSNGSTFDHFWESSLARECVAPLIVVCLLLFAHAYGGTDPLGAGIIAGGALIPPIWALNLSGYLDANGKNQLAGALAGLPATLAALACYWFVRDDWSPYHSGLIIGGAYSLGSLVSVGCHFLITARLGLLRRPNIISSKEIRKSFADGAMYCAAEFPAQFYARAVMLVVSESLGMHAAGVYIYIRQVVSASTQLIMLIKRVEFSRLRMAARAHPVKMADLFDIQRPSLLVAVSIFAGSFGARFAVSHLPGNLEDAAFKLPFFCASIPFWAISLSLGQVLIFNGRVRAYSAITFVNTVILLALAAAVTRYTGLIFLSMLDLFSHMVQAWACYRVVKIGATS